MDTIKLTPKYQKIENELIRNNEDVLHKNSPTNELIKKTAHMVAQGLQLAEKYSDDNINQ